MEFDKIITLLPGLKPSVKNYRTDCWRLFIDDAIIANMVRYINDMLAVLQQLEELIGFLYLASVSIIQDQLQ